MIAGLKNLASKALPEKRLYLKSDTGTRFIRISTAAQVKVMLATTAVVGWSIVSTSVLLMDSLGSGNSAEQSLAKSEMYSARLEALSEERDLRAAEARSAQDRFYVALGEISEMQAELLSSEERRAELETAIEVIQTKLRVTTNERDAVRARFDEASSQLAADDGVATTEASQLRDLEQTVTFLTDALSIVADSKDQIALAEAEARAEVAELTLNAELTDERNARIFEKLEDAVAVSLEPLDKMFRDAGLPTDSIIDQVRRGYNGQGGPLLPLSHSSKGVEYDELTLRAGEIFERMDNINLYRMAAEKLPFSIPVRSAFRYTSGFGYRRDPKGGGTRMHAGTDFAGGTGTPIHASADGVVTHSGWQSGYGRLVKIQHEFGYETRYAHLSSLRVKKGQRVSRGDIIGGMGSSGRSTGTHLHYEVRRGGDPVNPMTFIKAGQNVF